MKRLLLIPRLLWRVLVALIIAVFWIVRIVARTLFVAWDYGQARGQRTRDGTIRCPRGHAVPEDHANYFVECLACGFVYDNQEHSIWRCPAPGCGAVTPFARCPTCGLSVESPHRFGPP